MSYYNNILSLLSLVMALAILFIVLFGCQFKKYNSFEGFENEKKEDNGKVKQSENTVTAASLDAKPTILSEFENKIYEGLISGKTTAKELEELIQREEFTQNNLENMINYVEKFKNKISNKD